MFNRKLSFTIGLRTKDSEVLSADYVISETAHVLTALDFYGFTVTEGTGYWQGIREPALTFTILLDADNPALNLVPLTAHDLVCKFNQECVLWEIQATTGGLSYAE